MTNSTLIIKFKNLQKLENVYVYDQGQFSTREGISEEKMPKKLMKFDEEISKIQNKLSDT
jgi:hypothetical protein